MNSNIKPFKIVQKFDEGARKDFAKKIFNELRELSADTVGVSRQSYGPGEQEAMELIARYAQEEGLEVAWDSAANLVISLPGNEQTKPAILCGSHLDSVPHGGNFDGAAGVIAGLMALIQINRSGLDPVVPLKLIALRGEESAWFGLCYLGSYSLFGQMSAKDLDRKHRSSGRTLREYMSEAGADVDAISQGRKLIVPKDISAYVELHIEQGPVMVARDVPVGIVTGLRGNIRYNKVLCQGQAGHSGAVPRWLRHDAVLATADLLNRMDEHWRVLLERGLDLVLTAGTLSTNPETHGLTRIPGECEFSLEFRSQSIETLEAFDELVRAEVRSIEKERGVAFQFPVRDMTEPAIMDSQWISHLSNSCKSLNIRHETLPSGAGHDAAVFANNGIPSAMIFIRNDHGSHNPKEAMEIDDFLRGVEVLHHALQSPP